MLPHNSVDRAGLSAIKLMRIDSLTSTVGRERPWAG